MTLVPTWAAMSRIRSRYPAGISPLMIACWMAVKTWSVISEGGATLVIVMVVNVIPFPVPHRSPSGAEAGRGRRHGLRSAPALLASANKSAPRPCGICDHILTYHVLQHYASYQT